MRALNEGEERPGRVLDQEKKVSGRLPTSSTFQGGHLGKERNNKQSQKKGEQPARKKGVFAEAKSPASERRKKLTLLLN